jgi:UDP-N-acetylglucosamine--N-acetylmuramyl-(pentapeptide) pyrophosphoryl-undecaprenol N-acetylglucosamine transferase
MGKNYRNIIITGGGSGGHVMPALTVVRALKQISPDFSFYSIGSYYGIESDLFVKEGLAYKAISTGKLRRYFSWQNFTDIFRLVLGLLQSYFYLLRFSKKDSVLFCTGGFVIVPVVIAAWLQGKRIVVHEQTSRVGLANKIASYFASRVLVTFESSLNFFPKEKTIQAGYPLRLEILSPPSLENYAIAKLNRENRPILFLTGGGNGSKLLNEVLKECLDDIADTYFIIHQCGSQFVDDYRNLETDNYKVFAFINEEMVSLLNQANVVISRAGAGTVVELLSLGKPSIFIPT